MSARDDVLVLIELRAHPATGLSVMMGRLARGIRCIWEAPKKLNARVSAAENVFTMRPMSKALYEAQIGQEEVLTLSVHIPAFRLLKSIPALLWPQANSRA